MDDNEDCTESTNFQKLINRWSYHPERQLLEWLTRFHLAIERWIDSSKIQDALNKNISRSSSITYDTSLTFEQVDSVLKEKRTMLELANDEELNVFCKLSEILRQAHSSDEVSSEKFEKIRNFQKS